MTDRNYVFTEYLQLIHMKKNTLLCGPLLFLLFTGCSPAWFMGASRGDLNTVKAQLEQGLDVNTKSKALNVASRLGHYEVVKLLLDEGADVNQSFGGGPYTTGEGTALNVACRNGHYDVARLLLDRGADVNGSKKGDWTALTYAAGYKHADIVKLLVERGGDIDKAVDILRRSEGVFSGHDEEIALLNSFKQKQSASQVPVHSIKQPGAQADSVYLKTGKILRGKITAEDSETVMLESGADWQEIKNSDIKKIVRGAAQRQAGSYTDNSAPAPAEDDAASSDNPVLEPGARRKRGDSGFSSAPSASRQGSMPPAQLPGGQIKRVKSFAAFNIGMMNGLMSTPVNPTNSSMNPGGLNEAGGNFMGFSFEREITPDLRFFLDYNFTRRQLPIAEEGGYATGFWVGEQTGWASNTVGPFSTDVDALIETSGVRLGAKYFFTKPGTLRPWVGLGYGVYFWTFDFLNSSRTKRYGKGTGIVNGLTYLAGVNLKIGKKAYIVLYGDFASPVCNVKIDNLFYSGWTWDNRGGNHVMGPYRYGLALQFGI